MSYATDVEYEVWRRGGNPDAVDRDRLDGYREDGYEPEEAASAILRKRAACSGPNVVDDCEGMTEEEYYRGMEEAMNSAFCDCGADPDEEEMAANKCKACGKQIA